MKKILVFLISLLISTLTIFVVNYLIITPLIIDDKCNNDLGQSELTKFDELFYEISSNTGYHPEPTTFNFILTAIIGCIIGSIVYKILTR
jgi:polysaccharide biosynthesis protein